MDIVLIFCLAAVFGLVIWCYRKTAQLLRSCFLTYDFKKSLDRLDETLLRLVTLREEMEKSERERRTQAELDKITERTDWTTI